MAQAKEAPGRDGERPLSSVPGVASTLRHLLHLDATRGARAAVPALREAVRRVPELSTEPEILRGPDAELLAALAELCEVIGWILFDAGFHRRAHRANARALALAELCGDRWTARLVLLNHSMLQAHTGRPRAALETACRVYGPRALPPRVETLALIRRAHALALLGAARQEPEALLARARSRFLDGVCRHDPPWAWWIDDTELLGHQGWVLARLHRWDRAIPLLHRAATAPGGPAYRELFGAQLLAALAGAGAWREAEDVLADLAPRAARLRSTRTAESLTATALRLRAGTKASASLREGAVYLLDMLSAPEPRPSVRP
ncbi:DNA-binding protein [Streptomyces sp. WAC 01529]|uniref:DNA-binding protein n=1 Tax=Streptomyces sp. WAC 01529 TaxID=2203205 RepID=UPI000F6E1795|nr:DNA-binding protein [Streptomyces sp. WAC 01529]AZM51484.1 DNA-binding protein [Streptomyces sp. WAC 01529]